MKPLRGHLTKRQAEVLDIVSTGINAHGYAPSLTEICTALNLRSVSTVHKHLEQLRAKGFITRVRNEARAIGVIAAGNFCPTCGQMIPHD